MASTITAQDVSASTVKVGIIGETVADIKASEEKLGVQTEYVTVYLHSLSETLANKAESMQLAKDRNATVLVVIEITEGCAECLKQVESGQRDEYFQKIATEMNESSLQFVVTVCPEMNGDWNICGQKPAAFISAWRQVEDVFHDVPNASMAAQYNIAYGGQMSSNLALYYPLDPGEDLVDVVTLDGYRRKNDGCPSFHDVFADSVDQITTMFPGTRIIITETAAQSTCEGNDHWISEIPEAIKDWPIDGINIFDIAKIEPEGPIDWSVHRGAEVLAFNEMQQRLKAIPGMVEASESSVLPTEAAETKENLVSVFGDNRAPEVITVNDGVIQFNTVPAGDNAMVLSGKSEDDWVQVGGNRDYQVTYEVTIVNGGSGECGVFIDYNQQSSEGKWGEKLGLIVYPVNDPYTFKVPDEISAIKVQFFCEQGSDLHPTITNFVLSATS